MKRLLIALAMVLSSPLILAQPASLDQLLQDIREIRSSEQAAMREREAQFLRERDNQQALLSQASDLGPAGRDEIFGYGLVSAPADCTAPHQAG